MIDLEKYSDIYSVVDNIMGSGDLLDNRLLKLNYYAKTFIGSERGSLRSILMCLKAYRNNDIIKITFGILSDELRSGSKSGTI